MLNLTNKNLFLTTDLHAYHTNIAKGSTKWRDKNGQIPFDSVRDFENEFIMTEKIINNINEKVGEDDTLLFGGDLSFSGIENIVKTRLQIKCKNIIFIRGNHDLTHIGKNKIVFHNNKKYFVDKLFTEIHDLLYFKYNKYNFLLTHYPFESWDSKNFYHIHGHLHSNANDKLKDKRIDISLEGNNLYPYHIDEIIQLIVK